MFYSELNFLLWYMEFNKFWNFFYRILELDRN